jgi:hypothetical protein
MRDRRLRGSAVTPRKRQSLIEGATPNTGVAYFGIGLTREQAIKFAKGEGFSQKKSVKAALEKWKQ